jgi:hypothetical protein
VLSASVFAAERNPLVGNWKLVSNQIIIDNGPPKDFPGSNPRGYLILTSEGRMMAFIAAGDRKFGTTDAEMGKLFTSMVAYSGKYRIEGSDFVTAVDASWNEAWNGTEQRRHYTLNGDKLTIETAPQPFLLEPGKLVVAKLVWEREK